jgi:cell division protein FtsQ
LVSLKRNPARSSTKASRPSKVRKEVVEGFWDKPALLNLSADMLLLAGFAGLAWAASVAIQRLPVFPLRQVVVQGELSQVTRTQLEYVARGAISGNFFTVNVDAVRASFEKLPWVRRVSVRRHWPDGLELAVEEQTAVARWRQVQGEYRLVNPFGETFVAASTETLPFFSGPEGSAPRILARHKEFTEALAPLGRKPVEIILSSREAWQLKLDDGLMLDLGREETKHPVAERMERFVTAYRDVGDKLHLKPVLIDMRYPNGFALRAVGKTS